MAASTDIKLASSLDDDHPHAKLAVSAMVGAIALSRVMADHEANSLLADVRKLLLERPLTATE